MTATDTTEAASTEDGSNNDDPVTDNDGSTEEPSFQKQAEGEGVPRRRYNSLLGAFRKFRDKTQTDVGNLKRKQKELEDTVVDLKTQVDDLKTALDNLKANPPAPLASATEIEQFNKLIEAAVLAFADHTVVTAKFMLDGQFKRVTDHLLANPPIAVADLVDGSDAIFQAVASVMVTNAVNANKSATPRKDAYVVAQETLAAIKYNLGSTDPSNPGQLVKLAVDHGNS